MHEPPQSVFANNSGIDNVEIEKVREMIGQPLRIRQWNREASLDGIRHYAFGLGDDNPLWSDEDYAQRGPYGSIVAPPTYFYSVWPAGIGPGLPGLQVFHAGGRWEIARYARVGERIVADAKLVDVKELVGKRAGRMILQVGEVNYCTTAGELLAKHTSRTFRIARVGYDASSGLKYEPRSTIWSDEQLDNMEGEVYAQTRRGATSLYYEDVSVGDQLPTRLKGPLTTSTMMAYHGGNLSSYLSTDMFVKHRRLCLEHPELAPNNRSPKIQAERVSLAAGHQDPSVARAVGMPGVYDNGWMRIGWAQQLVTDWIGDSGTLKMIDVSIKLPNTVGDIVRFSGGVTGKRDSPSERTVEIEINGHRQDGEISCSGTAEVNIPSR
jgi:acyl dehydratase